MKIISRRYIDSSSFKMALLFTVLLSLSAGILGYFLVDFGRDDFLRETEAAIDSEIKIVSMLGGQSYADLVSYIRQRAQSDPAIRFRFEDKDGKFIAGTIDPRPTHLQKLAEGILGFSLETEENQHLFAAKIYTFQNGSRLIVARNIQELVASYDRLKHLIWLIMFLMLCVVIVSFGISYFVVSRINHITNTAQTIAETSDFSKRLSIDSQWDDLSNLSLVLNGFLNKIENAINDLKQVGNNIAHDLRTPLTGLRNEIESLKGASIDDIKIDKILAEADRILAIFQALLRIANIEKAKRSESLQTIFLETILQDVADLYDPVAEEKNMRLDVIISSQSVIKGDSDLLFQLFANLVDNAIKFSPPYSVIRLIASQEGNHVNVQVEDQGPGIPFDDHEHVFKHFFRGDNSRTTPGNGLGLSLVKAIADRHGANITLHNLNPGLSVNISFQPYQ